MAELTQVRCPVCAAAQDPQDPQGLRCPVCGFSYAFASRFADEEDIRLWLAEAGKRRGQVLESTCLKLAGKPILSFGDRAAAIVLPDEQLIVCGGEKTEKATQLIQAAIGGRHCLLLYRDGHVEARKLGPGVYGQYNVSQWQDVSFLAAGANCSYGVRRDGTVLVSGLPPVRREEIENWTDMSSLAEAEDFVVGLTRQGQLRLLLPAGARSEAMDNFRAKAAQCRDIVAIAAARNFIVALDNRGQPHCLCARPDDAREAAESWTDVVSVAADSHYVVGLTSKGKLLLAGARTALDAGRFDTAQWQNLVTVACSRAGIGAVTLDGRLLLAGNIVGAQALVDEMAPYAGAIAAGLIR